jgi:hypothetical protein
MTDDNRPGWIPELELEDAQIKWAFSHFDGREDTFNDAGAHNFQVIIPNQMAPELIAQGWPIREMEGYEEGDPPEYLLKVKISYKFEDPKIFLIKNGRKYRCAQEDLADIKRSVTEKIDVIISPSRWEHAGKTGVSAYCKELYAHISQSRFANQYDDMETI